MSLQQDLVDALGSAIASGAWPTGTAISVDEIGARHGVSRTVARESVRSLEARGMVRGRPRVGTVVQPEESWDLLDPDVIRWRTGTPDSSAQLEELLDLRAAIEPVAARLAAERATGAEHEELDSHLERMREAFEHGDVADFTRADLDFHRTLVLASGNRLFRQLWGTVHAALGARYHSEVPAFSEHTPHALDRHEQILRAVRAGDADSAEAAASVLIRGTREQVGLIR